VIPTDSARPNSLRSSRWYSLSASFTVTAAAHSSPATATVSKPADDPKALAKEFAGKCQENEYTPDEHITNIRLAGARRRWV
jgi:hypothetical protein